MCLGQRPEELDQGDGVDIYRGVELDELPSVDATAAEEGFVEIYVRARPAACWEPAWWRVMPMRWPAP